MQQPLPIAIAALYVAGGGALGSVLRYLLTVWLQPLSRGFPVSILIVNMVGSFAITSIGAATMADARYPLSEGWRLALLVGVCGGFTTFSSFSLQTLDLLRAGFLAGRWRTSACPSLCAWGRPPSATSWARG